MLRVPLAILCLPELELRAGSVCYAMSLLDVYCVCGLPGCLVMQKKPDLRCRRRRILLERQICHLFQKRH